MNRTFYILSLLLLSCNLWAQKSIIEEIREDKNISGGGYYAYPYPEHPLPRLTPAPKGYKPFYISHYARHGSRYYWSPMLYIELDSLLSTAHRKHLLTNEGEAFYNKFMTARQELSTGVSELTQLGWEQHQRIARNMYNNFP